MSESGLFCWKSSATDKAVKRSLTSHFLVSSFQVRMRRGRNDPAFKDGGSKFLVWMAAPHVRGQSLRVCAWFVTRDA